MTLADLVGVQITEKLSRIGYEERKYQTDAASLLFGVLKQQQSALLELPPGLGKTFVSQLIVAQWHQAGIKGKQLVVVPTTLLIGQHLRTAAWLKPDIKFGAITSDIATRASRLRYVVTSSSVIITTPLILWNALKTGMVPWELLDSISFCIIDEYDEFTKSEEGALRLHSHLEPLYEALQRRHVPILGLSAASPFRDPKAAYWNARLGATVCTPAGEEVDPYLPQLNVHFLPVNDPIVTADDQRISDRISHALREAERFLSRQIGTDVSLELAQLIPLLASICSGERRRLQVITSRGVVSVNIASQVRGYFSQVQQYLHERLLLYEDMNGVRTVADSIKVQTVLSLVGDRLTQLGLLMVRYVALGQGVAHALQDQGVETAIVHGQLEAAEREANLERAIGLQTGTLVMTRRLGGRGFDFPQADYVVFYSPKQEEAVMWQELLRIRSSRRNTKDAYILYYAGTVERDKATRLCEAMQGVATKGYNVVTAPA